MAVYPAQLDLPYRVSNRWLEERTLEGELVSAEHRHTVELDRLDEEHRGIAIGLVKAVNTSVGGVWDERVQIEIIGSALDPSAWMGEGTSSPRRMTDAVVRSLGPTPVLPEPVNAPEPLLEAWRAYADRYIKASKPALKAWIAEFFSDAEAADDKGVLPNGANISWWRHALKITPPSTGVAETFYINGRQNFDAFHTARGALQLLAHTRKLAGEEHFEFARRLAYLPLRFESDAEPAEVAEQYRARVDRLAAIALARAWTAQRQRDGFELEMLRWSSAHGSPRLEMGIRDGYRMMPVYLQERLSLEAPGFYAHLAKDHEKPWQPRTGPSEEALRLRRAVEQRLKTASPYMGPLPQVEIGWIKEAPLKMVDEQFAYDSDEEGYPTGRKVVPFEAIVVPDYLGRYVLLAGVWTTADDQPPDFMRNEFILNPAAYDVDGLPCPPSGVSVARDPFGVSSVGAGVGDDDIPF